PPSRPEHDFASTPLDLLAQYSPPAIAGTASTTRYQYDRDRRLILITQPDGATIGLGYDPQGHLSGITQPRGPESLSYDSTTGQLASLTAPDGGGLSYAYDGSLLTSVAWSGTVVGRVAFGYNADGQVTSEAVDSSSPVAFRYDLDGLLVKAGDLSLT